MNELKPCPFCCGEAEVLESNHSATFYCGCDSCETRGNYYDTEAEAIEAWNTRAERTCELNGTISWEWHTTSTTFYTHSLSCGHDITTTEQEPPSYCEECGAKVVS